MDDRPPHVPEPPHPTTPPLVERPVVVPRQFGLPGALLRRAGTVPPRVRALAAGVALVAVAAAVTSGGGAPREAQLATHTDAEPTPAAPEVGEPAPAEAGETLVATIQDTDVGTELNTVEYTGGSWTQCGGCDIATDDASYYYGYVEGDAYTLRFQGTRVVVHAPDDASGGTAAVTVDEQPAATPSVDFAAPGADRANGERWDSGPLPEGEHTVTFTIEAPRGDGNPVVLLDRAEVYGGTAPAPTEPVPTTPPTTGPPAGPEPQPEPPAPPTGPAPAPTGEAPALLGAGVFDPYEFAGWLGRPVDVWETWNNFDTWEQMVSLPTVHENMLGEGGPPLDRRWEGVASIAQPMWAAGQDAATCAGGANDGSMAAVAGAIREVYPNAYIRLGWEMDGAWFGDQQAAWRDPGNWVECWRRWHGILKAASPGFQLAWNPNWNSNTGGEGDFDIRTVWPGDEYVDAAGPDYYDFDIDPDATGTNGAPVGINQWVDFVVDQHHTPFMMGEWGLNGPNGGGDDPAFIHQVFDVLDRLKANGQLAYASYYALADANRACVFEVHVNGCNPQSTAAYLERASSF